MLHIGQAETTDDLDAVRSLLRAFVAWHHERHAEFRDLIDIYFDKAAFERELAELPGVFAPPEGWLLLAREDGTAVGCVALRNLGEGICEMKRMFVDPDAQGDGVGRALVEALIDLAKAAGYRTMRLDTGPKQIEAQGLYQQLGFEEIAPYYEVSDRMAAWLLFMELDLQQSSGQPAGGGGIGGG